jgi:hypothetical protein
VRARVTVSLAFALGASTATSAYAPDALANGRFPAASQLVVGPSDPNLLAVRTTFGLLVSRDRGTSFDWVCETALGYSGVQDPSVGVTASGAFTLGTFGGLLVSPDTGCAWSFVAGALTKVPVDDIVVRPDTPSTALALTRKHTGDDDAGAPVYLTQIYASSDNGGTWSKLGVPLDPGALTYTLEVAKSDPQRLYVSGLKGTGASAQALLFVSTDGGATWTPRAIPLDATNERAPFIAAVDPAKPDVVYVRTSGPLNNRLLVTTNAGQSWDVKYTGGQMLGFALSPDGSKVYLGGPNDGVQLASTTDFQFAKKSSIAVQCLATSGTTLYACSNDKNGGFAIGASTDDGATFVAKLHLTTIRGAIVCSSPDASASVCAAEWPFVNGTLNGGADAGTPDDSGVVIGRDSGSSIADGGTNPANPSSDTKSCGCREASTSSGIFSSVALVLATMFALRRSRRKLPATPKR